MSVPAAAGSPPPANKGVKQGLPAYGLTTAEDAALKLWEVARLGTATPEVFARQFGEKSKPSGGGWDTRMAILRGFKLVRFEGKDIGLSTLGQQLVNSSDPDGQRTARRTAVLNLKAYRELVTTFDKTPLPDETVLATRLQFDYGKKADFALRAAKAFKESLAHAEMLGEGNVVLKDGMAAAASLSPEPPATPGDGDELDEDAADDLEIDAAFNEEEAEDEDEDEDEFAEHGLSASSNVKLDVTLDLSHFRAEEVIQIINALGLGGRA